MKAIAKLLSNVAKNPLLLQSFWSLLARFAGVALNFAVVIIITNQLTKSSAGDILLLMTFVTGIALISRLGIDQLLMKEIASSHHQSLEFRSDFLKICYKAVLLLSLAFMLIWIAASPYMQTSFFSDSSRPTVSTAELIIASVGVLFFNLVILNSTFLKAIKKTVLGVLGQNALTAITLLLLIMIFWKYFSKDQYVIYLYTASLALAGILAALFTRHVISKYSYTPADKSEVSSADSSSVPGLVEVIKKSIPLAPISIISYLMIFTDTIMVGWFLSNEQVAEYSVASRVSYIVLFFLQAMEATIYPRLLNKFKHKQSQIHAFFWQSTALVISVVFGVTLFMYLLSDWILMAFGREYGTAKQALGLLLIAQFFRAASITFSFMFIIREKVKYLNMILMTAFIVNVAGNIVLIQRYDIEGAALATLIANITLLALILLLFYKNKLLKLSAGAES